MRNRNEKRLEVEWLKENLEDESLSSSEEDNNQSALSNKLFNSPSRIKFSSKTAMTDIFINNISNNKIINLKKDFLKCSSTLKRAYLAFHKDGQTEIDAYQNYTMLIGAIDEFNIAMINIKANIKDEKNLEAIDDLLINLKFLKSAIEREGRDLELIKSSQENSKNLDPALLDYFSSISENQMAKKNGNANDFVLPNTEDVTVKPIKDRDQEHKAWLLSSKNQTVSLKRNTQHNNDKYEIDMRVQLEDKINDTLSIVYAEKAISSHQYVLTEYLEPNNLENKIISTSKTNEDNQKQALHYGNQIIALMSNCMMKKIACDGRLTNFSENAKGELKITNGKSLISFSNDKNNLVDNIATPLNLLPPEMKANLTTSLNAFSSYQAGIAIYQLITNRVIGKEDLVKIDYKQEIFIGKKGKVLQQVIEGLLAANPSERMNIAEAKNLMQPVLKNNNMLIEKEKEQSQMQLHQFAAGLFYSQMDLGIETSPKNDKIQQLKIDQTLSDSTQKKINDFVRIDHQISVREKKRENNKNLTNNNSPKFAKLRKSLTNSGLFKLSLRNSKDQDENKSNRSEKNENNNSPKAKK